MRVAVAAALFLVLLPGFAAAQSIRLMDTTVLEYHGDNGNELSEDDNYGIGLTKFYLNGQLEQTSLAAQVDSVLLTNTPDIANPTASNPSLYANDVRLERIALTHSFNDEATVTLGDNHQQLGRGLVLSLRRVDELGTDQALRGGAASYQGDFFSTTIFGGITNIANLDVVTQRYLEDPNDLLAGASTTFHLGPADLSFHGIYLQPKKGIVEGIRTDDQTIAGGSYVDFPVASWLSLYLEGALEQYRLLGEETQGTAAYGSADIDLQVVSLLVEGLYMDHFQIMGSPEKALQDKRNIYNLPPTLERIDQEVLDNENVRGGRAKVSRPFLDGALVLYVSGMYRQYGNADTTIKLEDGSFTTASVDAIHGYTGFEYTYGGGASRWYASGGYRQETQDGALEAFKTMRHAETDWVQSIGGPYALHLTVGHEDRNLDDRHYIRGTTLVGLDRTGTGSLMAEIGYDTFKADTQQTFFAVDAVWEVAEWMTMKGVFGSQRGGIKCIGGVCRDFPAFSGVRLEATVMYDAM